MRRYLATCDDCPTWQHLADTERAAQQAASRHARDIHDDEMLAGDLEAFIRAHQSYARYWAQRTPLGSGESFDDVHADAMVGLWDAARRWDRSKGSFATFAGHRIRGAIADGRRSRDPLNRAARQRGDQVPLSLDLANGDTRVLLDTLADPSDAYAEVDNADERAQQLAIVRTASAELTPRQRDVVFGRLAGRTLAAIAVDLGVTESRVKQLESQAAAHLRRLIPAA